MPAISDYIRAQIEAQKDGITPEEQEYLDKLLAAILGQTSVEEVEPPIDTPLKTEPGSDPSSGPDMDKFLSNSIYQSVVSFSPAPNTAKTVIDWAAFWNESNIPVLGYDAIDNKLVVLKGADHSADSSKDILVYDFLTGTFTKGDTKFSGTTDISNMITDPGTGELVAMHNHDSSGQLKRFTAHQPVTGSTIAAASQTVNIVTPFFDFGSSATKKRLYKVLVLCTGTNLNDLNIAVSYDGDTDTYATDIFTSNTFTDIADAADWDTQTFTVSSPTDFENISIKIYSSGAMTTANWGISEISFIYRAKGIR